jgi:hypothetical protein
MLVPIVVRHHVILDIPEAVTEDQARTILKNASAEKLMHKYPVVREYMLQYDFEIDDHGFAIYNDPEWQYDNLSSEHCKEIRDEKLYYTVEEMPALVEEAMQEFRDTLISVCGEVWAASQLHKNEEK